MQQLKDEYKKIFSRKLIYYMNLRNKTQSDIINDLNINKSAISSWVNGTRLPRMNKIELLANYLHVNISDLIQDNVEDSNYFEFISEDDAMFPLLDIGDIALIYKQSNIENGATHLIILNGKKTIRKIILNEDKTNYILLAMNNYCKDITIPVKEIEKITILGKVVKVENESAFKY